MSDTTCPEAWVLLRVDKPGIYFLRYTMEAYEGLCIPTTLPGGEGLVRLTTSLALRPELEAALEGLGREMPLEIIGWGEGLP